MLNRNIRLLTWFNFFTDLRFWAPITVLYFSQVGGSFVLGMSVFTVFFISSALFEVPTGIFSDKIGRKNTAVWGSLASVIAIVLYSIGISPLILYAGAIFEGLSRALYSGNNDALLHGTLAETNQEHEYHEFLGRTSSMFQIATAIAAIIGGFLAGISFSLVLWISVIPQIICVILALQMKEPKVKTQDTGNIFSHLGIAIKRFRENKKLRLLSIASMINFGVGNSSFEFQQVFYKLIWPVWALGIARAIANTSGAISFYISGKVINRFSPIKMLLADSIITPIVKSAVALFITPFSPAIMAFMSILFGFGAVSGNTLQQKEFTNEQRATMSSLISLGGSLCTGIAALLLGLIADKYGIVTAIVSAQVILLANSFFYIKLYKNSSI